MRRENHQPQGAPIDLWYSGKAHEHGGNIQALMRPDGVPWWLSDVEPGSVHDLTAARTHVLGACYPHADLLPILTDLGYDGAGHGIHVLFAQSTDGRRLGVDNRTYNMLLRRLRCLGERGFALLASNESYGPGGTSPLAPGGDLWRRLRTSRLAPPGCEPCAASR